MGIYQADIVSLYKEELPADKLCFYRNKCAAAAYSAVSEYWIAAELDRGNEELIRLLLDVLLGEGTQTKLTTSMLRGIFMSENSFMRLSENFFLRRDCRKGFVNQSVKIWITELRRHL